MKLRYTANRSPGHWRAHGRYLAREGAQREGERGRGFDADGNEIGLERRLDAWQRAGDRRLWKMIVSPENGQRLDLREHTRALLSAMEADLGTRLEWVGIDHHDTTQPHVHVAIRGVDEDGRAFVMDRDYIRHGIRARSEDHATRRLGYRMEHDRDQARERAVTAPHFGELDAALERRANAARAVDLSRGYQAENLRVLLIRRLRHLEGRGLAERTGPRSWQLSPDHRGTLGSGVTLPTRSEVEQQLGQPTRMFGSMAGLSVRGRLLAYARDEAGGRLAIVRPPGTQPIAFRTNEREILIGSQVQARSYLPRDARHAEVEERRRALRWQLVQLDREQELGRGR